MSTLNRQHVLNINRPCEVITSSFILPFLLLQRSGLSSFLQVDEHPWFFLLVCLFVWLGSLKRGYAKTSRYPACLTSDDECARAGPRSQLGCTVTSLKGLSSNSY